MTIDFGRTAKDYAPHRAGFPDRLFDRQLVSRLTGFPIPNRDVFLVIS